MEQIDFINKIVELKKDNPKAEIKICVDGDSISDYGWTAHRIVRVELDDWIEVDDRIYTDECSAKEQIGEMLYDDGISDGKLEELVDEYYKKHSVDAICVYTDA